MKIVQFKVPGPASVLDYVDVPTPEPKEGEVLVRAVAIGIGMPDVMIRRGVYNWMPPLPTAPGTEMSGVIEKLGPGATRFNVGQRVVVSARDRPVRGGCYAEYNATPEDLVDAWRCPTAPIWIRPRRSPIIRLPITCSTIASLSSRDSRCWCRAPPAARQCVGRPRAQRRAQGDRHLLRCGEDRFRQKPGRRTYIDRRRDDIGVEAVKAATQGKGVDFIMDFAGGPDFAKNFAMLAPYGVVVSYGQLAGKPPGEIYTALRAHAAKCLGLRVFSIHIDDHWREPMQAGMRWLIERLGRAKSGRAFMTGCRSPRRAARMSCSRAAR